MEELLPQNPEFVFLACRGKRELWIQAYILAEVNLEIVGKPLAQIHPVSQIQYIIVNRADFVLIVADCAEIKIPPIRK